MSSIKYYIFTRFFGIIILQVAVIVGSVWLYLTQTYYQDILDENFVQLESVSKNIGQFYSQQEQEIKRLTGLEDFQRYNKNAAKKLMFNYISTRKLITSVHYYNKNGKIEFATKQNDFYNYDVKPHYKQHKNPLFISFFEQALNTKKIIYTPPMYSSSGEFYHIGFFPVKIKNKFHGILSYAFFPKLTSFKFSLDGLMMYSQNFLGLVDQEGNVIISKNIKPSQLGKSIKVYMKKRGETPNQPSKYKYRPMNELKYQIANSNYYLLSLKIKNLPFYAVSGVNESVLLKKKKKMLDVTYAVIGISALFGIIISFLISNKLSSGINILVSSIRDLKLGLYKKKDVSNIHDDFKDALEEIEDLSIEIKKGKLLGNFWGQGELSKDESFKN